LAILHARRSIGRICSMTSLAVDIDALVPDPWREAHPFALDLQATTTKILDTSQPIGYREAALKNWMTSYQPCLFGKFASAKTLIDILLLDADCLAQSDAAIGRIIQEARGRWKARASTGARSAFVVVAAHPKIFTATPNDRLLKISLRLCDLLLPDSAPVQVDRTYRDALVHYGPTSDSPRYFGVGVDFFAAAGDQRWWHDHRIPGGIGYSLNSPGQMVRQQQHAKRALEVQSEMLSSLQGTANDDRSLQRKIQHGLELTKAQQDLQATQIDSLGSVLRFAMKTIAAASEQLDPEKGATWERATRLRPRNSGMCPYREVAGDSQIRDKDYHTYDGWYHTDHTVRSDFFRSFDGTRPADVSRKELDFTYLHDRNQRDFTELAIGSAERPRSEVPDE
jgi:hypothetical protein